MLGESLTKRLWPKQLAARTVIGFACTTARWYGSMTDATVGSAACPIRLESNTAANAQAKKGNVFSFTTRDHICGIGEAV